MRSQLFPLPFDGERAIVHLVLSEVAFPIKVDPGTTAIKGWLLVPPPPSGYFTDGSGVGGWMKKARSGNVVPWHGTRVLSRAVVSAPVIFLE